MSEVTLDEMLESAKRELGRRERRYPRAVIHDQMTQERADREIATQKAIIATLSQLHNQESNNRLPTPICSEFALRGTRIHDARTGKLVCTIWPEREASEKRLMGESWLDMRERTRPEREAIERHTEERAAAVCAFLNSQNNEGYCVPSIGELAELTRLTRRSLKARQPKPNNL